MAKELYDQINQLKKKLEVIARLHNFDLQHVEVLEISRQLDKLIVEITDLKLKNMKEG